VSLNSRAPIVVLTPLRDAQVEIVVEEAAARKLIPFCRRLGATGILTYDLLSEC
jgi:hypothetical protein